MEVIQMCASRGQAARVAARKGIKAFQAPRIGNQGYRLCSMPDNHPLLTPAWDFAEGSDWISHVEVQFQDEGREQGLKLVFVVTCFKDEIPEEVPGGIEIEPITVDLWGGDKEAFEHRARSKTVHPAGERAKSDVESPTKLVWAIADEQKIEGELTKEARAKIIELCVERGVNKSTAQTQVYKWAKANGK